MKGIKDEFLIYKFILKYSPNINNKFIFEKVIVRFKILMKSYLNKLLFKYKDDLDFSELSNLIDANILLFCKLFLNIKDTLIDRKNKINFFFDEFIYVLNPEFKEKFVKYKQISLDYLNFKDEDEEYFYELDSKLYLSMMLIFIRLKFGKYNCHILYDYYINNKYMSSYDIFLLFLKAYFNNDNKIDILYHYFLIDDDISALYPDKYTFYFEDLINYKNLSLFEKNIFIFFAFSQNKLKRIKYSLIYEFIKSFFSDDSEYRQLIKYKYTFMGISMEQNEELFYLINDKMLEENDFREFFSFFNIEPLLNNEENIKHKIKNLKKISLYLEEKKDLIGIKEIFSLEINKFVIKNIILFLKVLKKENDSFFNCVKDNSFLIKYLFYFFLKSYYINLSENKGKNLLSEDEDSKLIRGEIYNFFIYYKAHEELIHDFSEVFFYLYSWSANNTTLINILYKKMLRNKTQIMYNYFSFDASIFNTILKMIY